MGKCENEVMQWLFSKSIDEKRSCIDENFSLIAGKYKRASLVSIQRPNNLLSKEFVGISKMVKGKISSKSAEKKKERIAMQRKMDARLVFVNAANQQEDPLASLPSFKVSYNFPMAFI